MSRRIIASCLLLALAGPGCAGLATYGENVTRDLSDVIDVRYGTGFGLAASLQAVPFKTGLGCSSEWYRREWFGRKSVEVRDGLFAHGLIFGFDGDYLRRVGQWTGDGDSSTGSSSLLIFGANGHENPARTGDEAWFTEPGGDPPNLTEARIGGTVFLPAVNAGLYFNFGETIDFLCSLVAYDLMNDDGYPKFFTPGPEAPDR
jgi:hypothetical protein